MSVRIEMSTCDVQVLGITIAIPGRASSASGGPITAQGCQDKSCLSIRNHHHRGILTVLLDHAGSSATVEADGRCDRIEKAMSRFTSARQMLFLLRRVGILTYDLPFFDVDKRGRIV